MLAYLSLTHLIITYLPHSFHFCKWDQDQIIYILSVSSSLINLQKLNSRLSDIPLF